MSDAQVRVGGVLLDTYAAVGDLVDSTIWRLQGYSGDYEASWTWAAPAGFAAPWFHPGAAVEIIEGGLVTWSGFLGDPSPGDPWQCTAFGDGANAANFTSGDPDAANINASISAAHAAGMRWSNYGNDFTGGAFTLAPGYVAIMLDTALDRVAAAKGKVWYVTCGVGSLRAESTDVDWVMEPDSTWLGVTDKNYKTELAGFYVSSVDGDGKANGWNYTVPSASTIPPTRDLVAEARLDGPRQGVVDLTALGLLSSGAAYLMTAERFAQVGARAGFTNGFEMTALNSRRSANSVPGPLAVRAGDRVEVPGVTDMHAATTYESSVVVTVGKATRYHADDRTQAEPVGMVDRNFQGALSAAQPKETAVEVL